MEDRNDFSKNYKLQWFQGFIDHVFASEGLKCWKIVAFHDSFDGGSCDGFGKRIEMDGLHGTSWYYLKEQFLHEVAHALDPLIAVPGRASGVSHDPRFFKRYGELLIKYAEHEPTADVCTPETNH